MQYSPAILLGFIILLIITRPFTILFHELGHAIPVMLLTKKGATVFIGSYGNQKHSFKLSFGGLDIWFRYNPIKWYGGLCIPKAQDISLNKQFIYILSGAVFSVVIAGVLFYLTFYFDLHGFTKLVCVFALGSTVFDLFENLIPRNVVLADGSSMQSDGYYLFYIQKLKKFSKEYTTAIELYNNNEYEKAAAMLQEFISHELENEDIYRLAYMSCIFIKNYEKAYELLEAFKGKYELNANDYYNFGLVCTRLKSNEKMTFYFKQSLELDPNNAYSLNAIGYDLNTENKYSEAIPYLNRAIAVDKEFAYAYNNRGHAKIETGELQEGLADIKYSLELDEENSYAYRNLGIYHLKLKQFEKAKRLLLKAKELDKETELLDELIAQATVQVL